MDIIKHAVMILAHDKYDQLATLLTCIDSERTDIFIHIDKKAFFSDSERDFLLSAVKHSRIFFTRRTCVSWGAYSMVNAELLLLEMAVETDRYCYFHLISGADLPLKSIDKILEIYDRSSDLEYINVFELEKTGKNRWLDRIKYYYPFLEKFQAKDFAGKVICKASVIIQKLLRINRLAPEVKYGLGTQWFSITEKFARHVLSQKVFIERTFRRGLIPDELFLQTVYLNWDCAGKRFVSGLKNYETLHTGMTDTYRAIDWERGTPYIFREGDYEMLINSGMLWARKFDKSVDSEIVRKIVGRAGGRMIAV